MEKRELRKSLQDFLATEPKNETARLVLNCVTVADSREYARDLFKGGMRAPFDRSARLDNIVFAL